MVRAYLLGMRILAIFLFSLLVIPFAHAQTTVAHVKGGRTANIGAPQSHAYLQERLDAHFARFSNFDCTDDFTPKQMEAIIYKLSNEQLPLLANVCQMQAQILQDYVDSHLFNNTGRGTLRQTVRAMLAGSRSAYFRGTRISTLDRRERVLRLQAERRRNLEASGRPLQMSDTAANAQRHYDEYQRIRAQRRSAQ